MWSRARLVIPPNRQGALNKKLRLALKLLVSALALAFAFADTDPAELARIARATDWPLMAVAVALSVASVAALSLRWKKLLEPIGSPSLRTLLRAQYVGLFGNNVLPLRAGEFMRADYVRKRIGQGFLTVLGTIFVERSLDLLVVGAIFGCLVLMTSFPGVPAVYEPLLVIAAIVAALLVVGVVRFRREIAAWIAKRFERATAAQSLIVELLTYRALVTLLAASALVWTLYSFRFQAVLSGIGLPVDLGLVALLLVATAFGFLIPAAPGALGTYHLAVVFSMHELYGIDLSDAQAASILLHLSAYVPSTLIGLAVFLGSDHELEETVSEVRYG